jgi:hypothetical protein
MLEHVAAVLGETAVGVVGTERTKSEIISKKKVKIMELDVSERKRFKFASFLLSLYIVWRIPVSQRAWIPCGVLCFPFCFCVEKTTQKGTPAVHPLSVS